MRTSSRPQPMFQGQRFSQLASIVLLGFGLGLALFDGDIMGVFGAFFRVKVSLNESVSVKKA